jgi:YVTN family beta-propeller protein
VAFDGAHVWVANSGANSVTALRGDGSVLATYATGKAPFQVVFDGRHIWLANSGSDSVSTSMGWR